MTAGWILIIMINTTSGKFVEKIAIGPFATRQQCQAAKIEGLNRFRLEKACVTQAHFEGRTIDPGMALD
jgi:hypothetical protein